MAEITEFKIRDNGHCLEVCCLSICTLQQAKQTNKQHQKHTPNMHDWFIF